MRPSFIFTLMLIIISSAVSSSKLRCYKLFKNDYKLFYYSPDGADVIEREIKMQLEGSGEQNARITTSVCGTVKVPKECNLEAQEAKLVAYFPKTKKCDIVTDSSQWEYNLTQTPDKEQLITIKGTKAEQSGIIYKFNCEAHAPKTNYKLMYMPNDNVYEVNIQSQSGCGISLDLFRVLSENALIAAICFTMVGFILCFFGLKFYNDFLMFFIPLLTLLLGFYFYMSLIEKSTSQNERIMLIFLMVFGIMLILTLAVLFSSVLYLLVCALSSYQLGLMTHAYLITQFDFFSREYTEWITIVGFFLVLFGIYIKLKDYFIMINTAALGSFTMIIALPYFKITKFDFLFDIEMDKFKDIKHLEPEFLNIIGLFVLSTILGILVQYFLFKRNSGSKYGNEDLKIDLKLAP